jgi:hypothetical protein
MEDLINSLFVRPVLWLANFIRRHPWKTLFLLGMLFFTVGLFTFIEAMAMRLVLFFPASAVAAKVSNGALAAIRWLKDKPSRKWIVTLPLIAAAPPLGWSLAAWNLVDAWRDKRLANVQPTADAAATPPAPTQTTGGNTTASKGVVDYAKDAVDLLLKPWWK